MKRLNNLFIRLAAVIALLGTYACSDDIGYHKGKPVDIETGIVLRIPNLTRAAEFASTRSEDPTPGADLMEKEGDICNGDIWLLIYGADDSASADGMPYKSIQLSHIGTLPTYKYDDEGNIITDKDGKFEKDWAGAYKKENNETTDYIVPMKPGNYKVYVVANLQEYLSETDFPVSKDDDSGFNILKISEENLNNLVLNFADKFADKKLLLPGRLPMACMPADVDEAGNDGTFNILSGNVKTLHCNLSFLCAKVRYTILFNNENGAESGRPGFSSEKFGQDLFLDFGDNNFASDVAKETNFNNSVNKTGIEYFEPAQAITLSKVQWPDAGENYPYNTGNPKDNDKITNLEPVEDWGYYCRRAWQGIIYVPENLSQDKRTTLTFDGIIEDEDGETKAENPYKIELIADGSNGKVTGKDDEKETTFNAEPIERGKFYDLVCLVKGLDTFDINFTVADWTLQNLYYALHGPFELIVEDTKIKVEAGEESRLWYHSDTEVTGESPKYNVNGKEVDFYNISTRNDSVIISINPEVPYSEYLQLGNDETKKEEYKQKYGFFHLKAGNLLKRIEVTPLKLDPFLNVSPKEITIDLREYIASGASAGKIPISFATNLDQLTITKSDGFPHDNLFKLEGELSTTSSNGVNNLVFSGLTDGNNFWTQKHDYTLTYKATANESTELTETVTIHILPYVSDYIIHFRADEWTNPHIYVYQCLELPSDLSTNDGRAGMTVGYSDNKDEAFASLEYSFTGKIAFRGWENYGGPKDDMAYYERNNPYGDGGVYKGFFIFNGHRKNDDSNWNPLYSGTNAAVYAQVDKKYYRDMDFCKTYRSSAPCSRCKSSNYAKGWPGIAMTDEGDGWWRFDLTGVATPGKALIMFADVDQDHNQLCYNDNADNPRRFPAHAKVGIPLFDYPDHEGWFYYNGDINDRSQNFVDDKPDTSDKTITLYWPTSKGDQIHMWLDGGEIITTGKYGDTKGTTSDIEGYYWHSFNRPKNDNKLLKIKYVSSSTEISVARLNSFKELEPGHRYGYLDDSGRFTAGKPAKPESFVTGDKVRIRWSSSYNNIHIWDNTGNLTGEWPGKTPTGNENGYKYYDFEVTRNSEWIKFILNNNNGNQTPDNECIKTANVYDSSIGRYVFTAY